MRTGRRELIRDLNRTLVLNLVRERGGLSRAELARISGLSPSTVTAITASLLEDGYILEDEQAVIADGLDDHRTPGHDPARRPDRRPRRRHQGHVGQPRGDRHGPGRHSPRDRHGAARTRHGPRCHRRALRIGGPTRARGRRRRTRTPARDRHRRPGHGRSGDGPGRRLAACSSGRTSTSSASSRAASGSRSSSTTTSTP